MVREAQAELGACRCAQFLSIPAHLDAGILKCATEFIYVPGFWGTSCIQLFFPLVSSPEQYQTLLNKQKYKSRQINCLSLAGCQQPERSECIVSISQYLVTDCLLLVLDTSVIIQILRNSRPKRKPTGSTFSSVMHGVNRSTQDAVWREDSLSTARA